MSSTGPASRGAESRGTGRIGVGTVTASLLTIARAGADDRDLAGQVGRACVAGLDIDGASLSIFTAGPQRETLWASDAVADLLEDLQFTHGEGPCMT
ncbi:MAG: hypothetical protein L0I76_21930, partial [Pseudonocardia sp.]|nr:hypothetical protein [Pseudonocardia sp.]